MSVQLIVISGFLGSGKTSAIAQMGKLLIESGKKVGVVTNDQSVDLVDTHFLQDKGFQVFEVTNGCFCCNFDEFTNKLHRISQTESPDIILAEPVGSCTDLIATIFKPIANEYTKNFILSPLSVLVDPKRAKRLMHDRKNNISFRNEINYLFDRQLTEADYIVLNKIDTLEGNEKFEIMNFLSVSYPSAQVLAVSAKDNIGIDAWLRLISDNHLNNKKSLDIDYAIYAKAEANLGWLNTFLMLQSDNPLDYNLILSDLIQCIKEQVQKQEKEIAHLKIYAVAGLDFAKAGITSNDEMIGFNQKMAQKTNQVNLIINARIEMNPTEIVKITNYALLKIENSYKLTEHNKRTEAFSPNYPKPKYRIQ